MLNTVDNNSVNLIKHDSKELKHNFSNPGFQLQVCFIKQIKESTSTFDHILLYLFNKHILRNDVSNFFNVHNFADRFTVLVYEKMKRCF